MTIKDRTNHYNVKFLKGYGFPINIMIIIGVIVTILLPNAFALTYEPSNFKLNNNPVICAFEPQEDPNVPNISEKMLALTEYVFDDWKAKLTNGARHSEWDMTLIKVMKSQQNTFDANQCNIRVSYLPNPNGKINDLEPTGMTQQYTDNTADIEIYYNNYGDGYYTNSLGTDEQLSKTLEHEFGHAFGLNHVILSDQELQNIDTGAEDMPSIMVPYALSVGIHHYSITPSDIDQLKSIYNYQGFGGYAPTTQTSTTPQNQVSSEFSVSTDKQIYQIGETVRISGLAPPPTNSEEMSVRIKILDPNEATQFEVNWKTDDYGNYNIWIEPQDMPNEIIGTYTVMVYYSNGGVSQTSFSIVDNSKPASTPSQDSIQQRLDPLTEKSHAYDWAVGKLGDNSFIDVVKQWIYEDAIHLPQTTTLNSQTTIPNWVKKDAKIWAQGDITDIEFLDTLQYLIDNRIVILAQ